jgi:hypothetical protein
MPPDRCADSAPLAAGLAARDACRSGNLSNDVLAAPWPSKAPWPVMPPNPLVMDPPKAPAAPAPPPNRPAAYAGVTMANTVAAPMPAMICLVFIVDLLL